MVLITEGRRIDFTVDAPACVLGKLLEGLEAQTARLDRVVHNVLTMARLDEGLTGEPSAVSLAEVVGSAVSSLGNLASATADLLVPTVPTLQGSIAGLNQLTGTLNDRSPEVNQALTNLPIKMEKLGRAASYGSWFQFYLCGIDIVAGPGLKDAQHLNIPPAVANMPTVNQPIYTNPAPRCNGKGGR